MTLRRSYGVLTLVLVACGGEGEQAPAPPAAPLAPEQLALLETLSPDELPAPPADVTNRFADDEAAARFGQTLFFDTGFAGRLLDGDNDGSATSLGKVGETGRVSCASCHVPADGFVDTRSLGGQISLAAGWGLRKPPSLLDVGQTRLVLWDGSKDSLFAQVFGPIESPLEMNSSRLFVAQELGRRYRDEYEAIFGPLPPFEDEAAFTQLPADLTGCVPKAGPLKPVCSGTTRGMPGDGADYDTLSPEDQHEVTLAVVNVGKAIAAYERLLTCGPSRFDAWMHGDSSAMNESEIRGAGLFVGKGECINCHSGPYLSDQQFHNVGMRPATINFSAPPDVGDKGAAVGVAGALESQVNALSAYSDGYDERLPESVPPEWLGAFKTPMLRCIDLHPSFMHTAQYTNLGQVVAFFSAGNSRPEYGTNELHPLDLTLDEQEDLVNFLKALTGPGAEPSLLEP